MAAFGIVYGLAARQAGFSAVEALAMSVIVLAGASQFAAVGLVAGGASWPAIVLLTFFLNARHILYSASLAPWFQGRSRSERLASAYCLADETFALSLAHFRRLGRFDRRGYWMAGGFVVVPWIASTGVGFTAGQLIPDPTRLGIDVVFPAAMAGLAVGLISGRREVVAALAGVLLGIGVGLVLGPTVGIVAGGLGGPLVGLAAPGASDDGRPSDGGGERDAEAEAATVPALGLP
ncbi:MAG TPA: AzlC family ABC transporter permease [Candidatus Limnocylindrales bacterium]|nr:AzlC family ABC transporter permease [Candidatus Limnocylindrales bacterium]